MTEQLTPVVIDNSPQSNTVEGNVKSPQATALTLDIKDELLNPQLMQSMTSVRQGRGSVGNSPTSIKMNMTFSSYTGMPAPSGAYLVVMQAKMEREQKKMEMMRMEARLRKLKTDEERTTKRIHDARKQQEFVANMKNEKQKQLE